MLAYHEHYTLADYKIWEGDWELVAGTPYAMSPTPSVSHQIVAGNILTQLNNIIRDKHDHCAGCHALMEIDWVVSNDTIVKPDVLILCDEVDEKVVMVPSVIFEVSSPSTAKRDELLKFQLYEKESVAYYILVYPETNVAKVYIWVNGSYQKKGDFSKGKLEFELSGWTIPLDFSAIWRS